jgi:hypothetical protein
LNRVNTDADSAQDVVIYGGAPEDANVAWVAAAAYKYEWSQLHQSQIVKERAFALLDALVAIHPRGEWDDGGLNAFFGLHSFAWAVLEWTETGDVDPERAKRWIDVVRASADHAMLCMYEGPYRPSSLTGQYANPEFYYLSGLAAAWRLTGETRFRVEASAALNRYDEWLYPGGGMPYFIHSQPEHGYQEMVVKSTALYWNLTGDREALAMLKRMAPYFPDKLHRSGLLTDAEEPHLKHKMAAQLNPGTALILASVLEDGQNRTAADIAVQLEADVIDHKKPSFPTNRYNWYNYQAATFAVAALRLMEGRELPPPTELPARRISHDGSFNGIRLHWDDVTAAVGVRQMNDSLAGWYLADPEEPAWPLGAAVDGIYFEVLQIWQGDVRDKGPGYRYVYRNMEWNPTVYHLETEGFAAVSVISYLCAPYWGRMPVLAGERYGRSEVSDWTTLQHWAVWRDTLIGLGALQCHADGGEPGGHDQARVRWRLAPKGRELTQLKRNGENWSMDWGGLELYLTCLEQRGGFQFAQDKSQFSPYAEWAPVLTKNDSWVIGDFVNVATVIRPRGADGQVYIRSLRYGAAALAIEPDGCSAYLWVVNLERQCHQFLWDIPKTVSVQSYKWRNRKMPPVPAGEPASASLNGGESMVWQFTSDVPIEAEAILESMRVGQGRRGRTQTK